MRYFLLLLLIIFHQPFASAQQQVKSEDEICLTFRYIWDGSLKETAKIKTNPVPETYKNRFESKGCGRFQLDTSSLLDWHRRFGDETSTEKAVEYITAPIHNAFANKEIGDGYHLISAHTSLAIYDYEGAIAFGSETLIKKALHHAKTAQRASKGAKVKNPNRYNYRQYSDLGIGHYDVGNNNAGTLSRLVAKIAARKAFITGKAADVDEAIKYFNTPEAKTFDEAIDWMMSEQQPLCEGEYEEEDIFDDLCNQSSQIYQDLIDYKISLGLLKAFNKGSQKREHHLSEAEQLIKIANVANRNISINDPLKRERQLHLTIAEIYYKKAQNSEAHDSKNRFKRCLKHAELSALYAPKYQMPSQWDRAAKQYMLCATPLQKMLRDREKPNAKLRRGLAHFGESNVSQTKK